MKLLIIKLLAAVVAIGIVTTCLAPLAAVSSTSDKASTEEVATHDQNVVNLLILGAAARK